MFNFAHAFFLVFGPYVILVLTKFLDIKFSKGEMFDFYKALAILGFCDAILLAIIYKGALDVGLVS